MTGAFRTDINGLRAYAVLAVLLYHLGIPGIASGYIGVDVFFVISGFLMASIILPKLEAGDFSVAAFYAARIRRILPALAVVCSAVLALGWFMLGPVDYNKVAIHIGSSLSFSSNFVYRAEQGYFDAPSLTKWLLHTWSLAVEAQFYLTFPLLLLALKKFQFSALGRDRILWALCAVSLALSVLLLHRDPEFTFFLLPTRWWELTAGSMVFLYASRVHISSRLAALLEASGIALILLSSVIFTEVSQWPSYRALLPVTGAAFVLLAARQHSALTGNWLAQRLGDWSYSLYLWHWPIVVYISYSGIPKTPWVISLGIAAALLLAILSYRFVELPTRRHARHYPRAFLRQCTVVIVGLVMICGAIVGLNGVPHRMPANVLIADREAKNREVFGLGCSFRPRDKKVNTCPITEGKPIKYVLWGDSHVGNIAGALRDTVNKGILYYSYACPPLLDAEIYIKDLNNRCRFFNDAVLAQLANTPKDTRVIMSSFYALYLYGPRNGSHRPIGIAYYDTKDLGQDMDQEALFKSHVKATLCRVASIRAVYAMRPSPQQLYDVPRDLVRRLLVDTNAKAGGMMLATHQERNKVINEALNEAAASCPNITVMDPIPYVCKNGVCMDSENGRPLYVDDNHLSEYGTRHLMPLFAKTFHDDLNPDWKKHMEQREAPAPARKRFFTQTDPGID